jgi:hypothetical protein
MPDATNSCETQMKLQAVSLNIANALRNDITNAQNDYNSMIQDIQNGNANAGQADGNKMWEDLQKIRKELALSGMTKIMGASNLKNIVGYVSSIEGTPNGTKVTSIPTGISHAGGGHWTHVAKKNGISNYCIWVWSNPGYTKFTNITLPNVGLYSQYASKYNAAVNQGQPPDQVFSLTTSSFNNLNQSVSGISSSIQAQMQYLNQNLQQYFGIYKSFFDSYSQLSSYIVNKTNNG